LYKVQFILLEKNRRTQELKKLLVLTLVLFSAFSLSTVNAAAKGGPKPMETVAYEGAYEEVCYLEDSYEVDLWAGQDILAGSVVVTVENGMLSVEVMTDYQYDDVHIGTYTELPAKRPAPGKMVFNEGPYEVGETVFLIVHVAFSDIEDSPVSGETAYGGNTQTGTNAWFYYIPLEVKECDVPPVDPEGEWTQETAYAYFLEDSIAFDENGQPWGWYSLYQEGTFDVYAGVGLNDLSKGTFVGTITVENGTAVFTAEDGVRVLEEHFYIGADVPARIPGQWNTIDMDNAVYMTFHLSVEILVEE